MKSFLACLVIGLLIFSGIRAPETFTASRGICLSGPVLEKAAISTQDTQEFRKTASNPLLLHSGFAPSAHPFDFTETSALSVPALSDFLTSHKTFVLGMNLLSPHDRPPRL